MAKLTQHKASKVCPITAPHDEALCGIVQARHRRSAEMNTAIDQQTAEEHQRAERGQRRAGGAG
jgi:hypothetical protein